MKSSLFIMLTLVSICCQVVEARKLDPIVWSIQNKIFDVSSSSSTDSHTIDVKLGDVLNIMCPRYSPSNGIDYETSNIRRNAKQVLSINLVNAAEYHAIYRVSKEEHDACRINDIELKQPILRCDRPSENIKFTLYISKFSPVPDAIEFQPGNNYYFISTSNGMFSGLGNAEHGTCQSNHMKLTIRVQDPKEEAFNRHSSASPASSQTTPTQTVASTSHLTPAHAQHISKSAVKPNNHEIDSSSKNTYSFKAFLHGRTSSTSTKPFRIFPGSTLRNSAAVKSSESNTKTVNDNIFILEPDSLDYNDIISQLMATSAPASVQQTNSDKLRLEELVSTAPKRLCFNFIQLFMIFLFYCYYYQNELFTVA